MSSPSDQSTPDPSSTPQRGLVVDDATRIRREAHRQVTDRDALDAVLDEALLAHVGVVRDGRPLVLPFACARDGDHLLLHGSTGSGLLRIAAGDEVCVEVTHLDGLVFARTTFDSSMRYRSAVVHGVAEEVPADDKARALDLLSDHLFPGRTAELRAPTAKELAATLVLRVSLESASVKVAAGPPEVDPDDHEPRSVWAGIVPLALRADQPLASPDVPHGVDVPASVRATLTRHGV
ncbi:pyridoxamine 5'-phosphate oxidase family protein [Nocardioides sp. HDW12B]|uniref:pyridoxamine 5'-phosphate oxidase family protein n=1 Tax=Nocardioides sp. HDW12B TaxID=2714939 RepID=UPI00140CECB5|nr:pyridoxamine 5'-phosphate oxidase family protein [Nocardioides sp. HDW12B]QIK65063.1 pyridoxamine 5'-phosphate oxidase family protein [Nocardioides sp. HDW12B]